MTRANPWPSPPSGIRPIDRLYDEDLVDLADALRNDGEDWFECVRPPESPGPWEDMAQDYDHEAELEAVPNEPTAEYRQQALDYVEEILTARNTVRPNSLRSVNELPDGIARKTSRHWVWYSATSERNQAEDDQPISLARTTDRGKYLFFTPDEASVLEEIIVEQFQKRPFESAKLPTIPNRKSEAVLCLYYSDDRYRSDLRETYQNEPEDETYDLASPYDPNAPIIMPRGFKTNAATRQNEYSDKFEQRRSG